jgi:hypothetical protein
VRWLLATVLLSTACAATPREVAPHPPGPTAAEQQDLEKAYVDLRRFDSQLQNVDSTAAATPDCGQITQLRDSICALAARICQLAARDTSPTIATERCADGQTRCKSAIERAQARGCPQK